VDRLGDVGGLSRLARRLTALVLLALALAGVAAPAEPPAAFTPDPASVQRWQQGWRYPQAGWTVVHIEGQPHERGLQHGQLLAAEIAAYIQALSEYWSPRQPRAAWAHNREVARQLFLPGYDAELRQEMQGVADGASAAGARVAGRRLDLLDIVTLNAANEIDTLPDAMAVPGPRPRLRPITRATPQPPRRPVRQRPARPQRCDAFIANGPATADGQIVFGHITMYDLYPANFYNVWLHVKPAQGLAFVMQTTPGGVHSGMDYAINEAGLLLAETTLEQGPWRPGGRALAARVRQAQQYADSIDRAAALLSEGDNGLAAAEWLLGDLRRNEIALLTLAGAQSRLHRGSRGEWFDGAEGFYWSVNNSKDAGARLQAAARRDGRASGAAAFAPNARDAEWLREYRAQRGRIDLDFARRLLSLPKIVSAYGVDAKYTDARLAASLQSWATFGPPTGTLWPPTAQEAREHAGIRPLVPNPWTLLTTQAPPAGAPLAVRDRPDPRHPGPEAEPASTPSRPVWSGALRPASAADLWLVAGFARLERILAEASPGAPDAADSLGVELAYYRAWAMQAARAGQDQPLAQTSGRMDDVIGYRLAAGKGVLFLNALRDIVGAARFDAALRAFGRQHDGQVVDSARFQAFLQRHTPRPLAPLFDWWLGQPGLPRLGLVQARARRAGGGWETAVTLDTTGLGPALAVPVTVETAAGDVTVSRVFDASQPQLRIASAARPRRVVLDKHGLTPRGNGSPFTVLSLDDELEQTLIVYGTRDEQAGNLEAARRLQTALRRREHNVQPALRADHELTEDEAHTHHLLLIGRPDTNAVSARLAGQFGLLFGTGSLRVREQVYAHPDSAVLAAGDNPLNGRYSLVLLAGLSSLATYEAAGRYADPALGYAPIVLLPAGRRPLELVPPLEELSIEPEFDPE